MTDIDLTAIIRDALGIEGLAQLYHIRNILSAMTPLDYLIFDVYEESQSQIGPRTVASIVVSDHNSKAQSEMIMTDLTLITAEGNFSIEGMEIPTSIDPQDLLRSSPEEILDLIMSYLDHRIAIIKWEIKCAYKRH